MNWLYPTWPAPSNVRSVITTRAGGVSIGTYASLNLADHVGDAPVAVSANRAVLHRELSLPEEPHWLSQVHGCQVVEAESSPAGIEADAVCARQAGRVCAVLTADCLPLLICDRAGTAVCAVHAGWRGLAAGVIEAAVRRLQRPPAELLVWLGPAIGPRAFEVGEEVYTNFVGQLSQASAAFEAGRPGHWLADIYQLARMRLERMGVSYVGGGEYCTVSEPERFFSYRRDGVTGRMASLIWLQD